MLVFIDTKFTGFKRTEFTSVGLVMNHKRHKFYAELLINPAVCNDFTLANVLPPHDNVPHAYHAQSDLPSRLRK